MKLHGISKWFYEMRVKGCDHVHADVSHSVCHTFLRQQIRYNSGKSEGLTTINTLANLVSNVLLI